jgi:hypothetical protein
MPHNLISTAWQKSHGVSRILKRDRELAFYGTEDLTPSEFYREEDAREARASARWVIETLSELIFEK